MQPIIAVAGASKPTGYQLIAAFAAGRLIAQRGARVVCGGLGGVMDAAAQGVASVEGGISLGLLPGLDDDDKSSAVTIQIATGLGQARNVVLARACSAMVAIGGGYGTLTEIGFALRLGKPLALIDSWKFDHASMAADPPCLYNVSSITDVLERQTDAFREVINALDQRRKADAFNDGIDAVDEQGKADAIGRAIDAVAWIFDQLSR